jgi:integrase
MPAPRSRFDPIPPTVLRSPSGSTAKLVELRDRVLLETAYAGGLRVSEIVALTWSDVLPRDEGRVQLSISGKGGKVRQVLPPAIVSRPAGVCPSRKRVVPRISAGPLRYRGVTGNMAGIVEASKI